MKLAKVFVLLLPLVLGSTAWAKKGVKVEVNLSPAGSFEIEGKRLKGHASKSGSGYVAKNIYIAVKGLKTGMDLRDEHLHKKLEKSKYPKISIEKGQCNGGKGSAVIKVKNIKKKIGISCKASGKTLKVKFSLNLPDFKFSGLSYMGAGVKDKVKVEAFVPIK